MRKHLSQARILIWQKQEFRCYYWLFLALLRIFGFKHRVPCRLAPEDAHKGYLEDELSALLRVGDEIINLQPKKDALKVR